MQTSYSRQYVELWRRHWWWRSRHALVMRTVAAALAPQHDSSRAARILDIGCCGGVTFDDLAGLGDVYGIEPDAQLVDAVPRWRDRIEHTTFGGDYESGRQYDLVLMLDVLEHIEDDAGALEALHRLLAVKGAAVITVPALMSLWSAHDKANLHYRRYGRRQLQDVLAAAGFRVRQMQYLFGWSLPLLYARRFLARRPGESYQVRVPRRPLNRLFEGLSRAEQWATRSLGLPVPLGSSLLAVVEPASAVPEPEIADRTCAAQSRS